MSYCAKVRAEAKKRLKGEGEGRRGNACPQTPRFWKTPLATQAKHWVTSQVLPSKRKYGQFKLFDNPNNNMFEIENETDLHCKVVQYIRRFYPDTIVVAGLGEYQDTPGK